MGFLPVLLLFLGLSAQATESTCTLQILNALIEPIHSGLASAEDRIKIEAWFADRGMSQGDAALRTFDLILSRRIEALPDVVRNKLKPKIRNVVNRRIQVTDPNTINGKYHLVDDQISLINPAEFFNSPIEYSTLIHEVEHAIQKHSVKYLNIAEKMLDSRARYHFEEEYGAMIAEWNYIHSLPQSVRESIIAEAERLPLSPEAKAFVVRRFKNGNRNGDEFLNGEWEAGRYSQAQIFDEESIEYVDIPKKYWVPVAAAASLVGYYKTCTPLIKNHRKSTYYQKVCSKVFGLPTQIKNLVR